MKKSQVFINRLGNICPITSEPPTKDSSIDLTCDDFRTLSLCYEARPSDWSDNNRDEEIIRIIDGIKCLSQVGHLDLVDLVIFHRIL